jgi:hypothetical protein
MNDKNSKQEPWKMWIGRNGMMVFPQLGSQPARQKRHQRVHQDHQEAQ